MRLSLLCLVISLAAPVSASAQPRGRMTEDPSTCRPGTQGVTGGPRSCPPCRRAPPGEPQPPCPCPPQLYECVASARVERLERLLSSSAPGSSHRRTASHDWRRLCDVIRGSVVRYDDTATAVDALRAACGVRSPGSVMEPMELRARMGNATTDAQVQRIVRDLPHTNPPVACQLSSSCMGLTALAVSPDGDWLASGSGLGVTLWRLRDRRLVHTLTNGQTGVRRVAFSPDSGILASSGSRDDVYLWRTATGQLLGRVRTGAENNAIAFVDDHPSLASAPEMTLLGPDLIEAHIPPTPAFPLITRGARGPMRVWRIPQGAADAAALAGRFPNLTVEPSRRVPDPRLHTVVSPDGSVLASLPAHGAAPLDFSVRLFDRWSGQLLQTLHGHQARVTAFAFSPDGRTLASADSEGAIRFWRVQTGAAVGTITLPRGPDHLVFLPDGRRLISGSSDGAIRTHRVPREALSRR